MADVKAITEWPVIPVIPPAVTTGQKISAGHENMVRQCLSDLWTDLQAAGAISVTDPTTTKGDLLVRSPTVLSRLAVGADGLVLQADAAQPLGLRWAALDAASVGAVPTTRQVLAGAGLSGGGPLTADVTLAANVVSVFGRSGAVAAQAGDYTAAQVTGAVDTGGAYNDPAWLTGLSWSKVSGAPAEYPPAAHTHDAAEVVSGRFQQARLGTGAADGSVFLRGDGIWASVPAGAPIAHTHDAADIVSGVLAVARLGTGSPDATVFLRGDGVWAVPAGGGGGGPQSPWTSHIDAAGYELRNAGRIGVGVTAPVQATAGRGYVTIKGASEAGVLELTSASADTEGALIGQVQFADSNNTAANHNLAAMQVYTSGSTAGNRGAYLTVNTRPDNSGGLAERMRIAANGDFAMWGNVGIGTSPAYRLDVKDNIRLDVTAADTDATFRFRCNPNEATWNTAKIVGSAHAGVQYGGQLRFFTHGSSGTGGEGTERMRIDSSGKVDIYNNVNLTLGEVGSGIWYGIATEPNRFFVGMESASNDIWRIYANPKGNIISVNGAAGNVSIGPGSGATAPALQVIGHPATDVVRVSPLGDLSKYIFLQPESAVNRATLAYWATSGYGWIDMPYLRVTAYLDAPTINGLTMQGSGVPPEANQILRSDSGHYVWTKWINTVSGAAAASRPGRVYVSDQAGDAFIRYQTPGVFAQYLNNWNSPHNEAVALGQCLIWKNFGVNHVIFDASQGVAPNGAGVNQTNAQAAWTASYPNLMGWNGSLTYGLRVDSARYADSAGSVGGDSGWLALPTNNNWTDQPQSVVAGPAGNYPPAGYRKEGSRVSLRGTLRGGITSADVIIATLPVGYRPAYVWWFSVTSAGSSNYNILMLYPDGTLRVLGSPLGWMCLFNIIFYVDS